LVVFFGAARSFSPAARPCSKASRKTTSKAVTIDYNFEGNGNTYSNNASGDVLRK
jgi:hypothetical protein